MEKFQQKKLFTPGPLCVTRSVKEAMLVDVGSRDTHFIQTVRDVRSMLLGVCGVSGDEYTTVIVQGSGTYSVEAALTTLTPGGGKVLVVKNGAYGRRIASVCRALSIQHDVISFPEVQPVNVEQVSEALKVAPETYSIVAAVHCETSTGLVNPVAEIGQAIQRHCGKHTSYLVDAMSSLGAIPLDFQECQIDFLVSSANKCIQGVPGFSYVIANKAKLLACKGWSRSLSLDLVAQYEALESNGQFRFTPPTHSLLAFHQALLELEAEGGVVARGRRYANNAKILHEGMAKMGFTKLLADRESGEIPIISTFLYPKSNRFNFNVFYQKLSERGYVIYPGKLTDTECFRIGTIGDLHAKDMRGLLDAIEQVCKQMDIKLPVNCG